MISSTQNDYIKSLIKLKQKKHRDEQGLFLVEGYHLVEEAKKAGVVEEIISTTNEGQQVTDNVMKKLAFTKAPQPIMAVCHKPEVSQEIVEGRRYLLLDCIQDPGNLGTIIRTALAFGYDQVILSEDCVDLYNDKVIRSTQGALFQQNIIMMNLEDAIDQLHHLGAEVIATSLHNASSIDGIQTKDKMAFVMGNEGNGVSLDIINKCDQSLYIPISSIESLNVAIASAITMYHFK